MPQAVIDPAVLDALFAPFDRTDAPGYAVGIAAPGQRPYRRGFGMASVELPVALSPAIRMRIGSTTKHFTALALLLLEEEGRLSLDDSPRRHLPELPGWAEAITLRQLLAHTSGMRDSLDLLLHSAGPGRPASPELQLRYLTGLDSVNFAPGASWNYNNGGYVLATAIIERTSGQGFGDVMAGRIFVPVGMHDTLVRALDTDLVPNSATLHVPRAGGGWDRGVFGTAIGGEGGIVSTVDDMLLWLRHMRAPTVGRPGSWAAIRTPLTTHGYGLGLFIERRRGLEVMQHAGAVVGGSCQMLAVAEPALDIILISNGVSSLQGYRLADAIIEACIPGLPPRAPTRAAAPVEGVFHSPATGRVVTLVAHEGAQAVRLGGLTLPAHADATGALAVDILPTDMRLTPSADGDRIDLVEFGTGDRLDRVTPPLPADALAGRYTSRAAAIGADIAGDMMTLTGPLGSQRYRVAALGPGLWEARAEGPLPMVATLEVTADGFLLTTGRTTRLRFVAAA